MTRKRTQQALGDEGHKSQRAKNAKGKKWDPFGNKATRGYFSHAPSNAPSGPRAMMGNHGLAPEPVLSPAPSPGVRRQCQIAYNPLPSSHPLKVEMEELKATREKRRLYWAGLAENLGEDWENSASYDRQTWEREEKLADAKFADLAGQIALTERGFPTNLVTNAVVEANVPNSLTAYQTLQKAGNVESSGKRQGGGPRRRRNRGRQSSAADVFSSTKNAVRGSKDLRARSRTSTRQGPVTWTQKNRTEAIEKWMEDAGMPAVCSDEASDALSIGYDNESNDDTSMMDYEMTAQEHNGRFPKFPQNGKSRRKGINDHSDLKERGFGAGSSDVGSAWEARNVATFQEVKAVGGEGRTKVVHSADLVHTTPNARIQSPVRTADHPQQWDVHEIQRSSLGVDQNNKTAHTASRDTLGEIAEDENIEVVDDRSENGPTSDQESFNPLDALWEQLERSSPPQTPTGQFPPKSSTPPFAPLRASEPAAAAESDQIAVAISIIRELHDRGIATDIDLSNALPSD